MTFVKVGIPPNEYAPWNGSAWTEVNDLPTSNYGAWAMGTSTSGIYYGGEDRPPGNLVTTTLTWDGTSWTEVADLSTARDRLAGSAVSSPAALAFAGQPVTLKIFGIS